MRYNAMLYCNFITQKLGQHLPLFIFSLCYCKEGSCWTNHFKKCDIKKNVGNNWVLF